MNGLQQEMFAAHNKILAYLVKLSHKPIENGQQYLSIKKKKLIKFKKIIYQWNLWF